jgi:hypothetical protein
MKLSVLFGYVDRVWPSLSHERQLCLPRHGRVQTSSDTDIDIVTTGITTFP